MLNQTKSAGQSALALSIRGVVAASLLSPAFAFSANVLEEVVVTAQKREQSMQDVGISVSAFSGDQMKALGVTDTTEITQQIPGFQLNTFSPNTTIFNLRGVSQNNFTDNLEAPIAVYIDDGYVASMNAISGQLFDVERVEVLRGPQGTLFGRNATGGLVHYLTKGADEEEFNGYVEAGVASFDRTYFEGAVGGAITDAVRGRVAARWEEADGYVESEVGGDDIGGVDGYAIRGALQIDISNNATLDLMYKFSEDDEVPTGGYVFLPWTAQEQSAGYLPPELAAFTQNVILDGGTPPGGMTLDEFTREVFFNPVDGFTPVDEAGLSIFEGDHDEPHKHFSGTDGSLNREIDNITAKFTLDLENGMEFVSITNYMTLDKEYMEDGDGLPIQLIDFTTLMDHTQWSQELRLSGEADNMRWQVGAYYLDMEMDGEIITTGNPARNAVAPLIASGDLPPDFVAVTPSAVQDYRLEATNWSLFGQVEYDLNDALTLIAGYRWSQDDKDMEYTRGFRDVGAGQSTIIPEFDLDAAVAATGGDQNEIDYGDFAARLQLDWRPTENTLVFASYNRGIKGGNWGLSAGSNLDTIEHDEETLHSYELGVKTDFADGLARFNATAFYYDYEDYQAFAMVGGTPLVGNSDASAAGAELELTLTPDENWDVILGASFMTSEVEEVQAVGTWVSPVGCASPAGCVVIDFPQDVIEDTELPNAPNFSLNYLVRYNWDALGGNMAAQVDGVYYDDQYLEVTNGGGSFQEAYGVSNARLTYTSGNENYQLTAWVKNLADEEYKLYNLDLGMLGATAFYAPPRTAGITASYSW